MPIPPPPPGFTIDTPGAAPPTGLGRPIIRKGVEPKAPQSKVVKDNYLIDPNTGTAAPIRGLPEKPAGSSRDKPQAIPGRPGWFMDSSGNAFQPKGLPAAGKGGNGLTPSAYSKIQGQLKALDLVEAQLNRVEKLYSSHLKGVGLQSFSEYLPTPKNRAFEKAANGILPLVRQALSTSAKDGDSDRELAVWQNLIPSHKSYDAENEENIATMRRLIKQNRAATRRILGEEEPKPKNNGWKVTRIK